jgi:hypothetical protein
MTLIDCRDPSGPLWGWDPNLWDPNLCCLEHALFPLDQSLGQMLKEALTVEYSEPFYARCFADLKRTEPGCAPLEWENGRVKAMRQFE